MKARAGALLAFLVLGGGVALAVAGQSTDRPLVPTSADQIRSRTLPPRLAAPAKCAYREAGSLPDPKCTPGAINRAVTQKTIGKTICVKGWTATVRPPESVTQPEKLVSMREYGFAFGTSPRGYEYDHLIPLELGGATNDPRNLWPEPHATPLAVVEWGSLEKDAVENRLRALVCSGGVSLARARRIVRTDWRVKLP